MTEILAKTYLGNTLWEWVLALSVVLFSIVGGKILYWFFGAVIKKLTAKTETQFDDVIIDKAEEPIVLALTLWGIEYGFAKLHFTQNIDGYIENGFDFLITLTIAWLIVRVVDGLVDEFVVPIVLKSENNLDDAILPIVRRGFRMIVWVIAFVIALNNAGYDVGAFLAGLGISGLALAIAARNTVMNIIGGLTILVTQPFKITDRILIDKYDGIVVDIGLMNTILKIYVDDTIASIPNKFFTDKEVINITQARAKRSTYHITLSQNTSAEQIKLFIAALKNLILEQEEVENDCKISLHEFNEIGFKIEFIYYIKSSQNSWETKAIIGTKVVEILRSQGIELGKINNDNHRSHHF